MPDNITPVDQFEQDIAFIRTTDKVLGDPPGTTGALSGPINKVLQKIANSLLNLKTRLDGLNITVPNASTTVKGIAELATKQEAETGSDTTRIVVPKRVYDILKHVNAQATTTTRGTVEKADQTEGRAGTDNERYMTPLRHKDALQNATSQATISANGTAVVSVLTNIQIGNLLFMRIGNGGNATIPRTTVYTLGGGAWRILSATHHNKNDADGGNNSRFYPIDGTSRDYLIHTITYNADNTTFYSRSIDPHDELNIIAVLS